MFRACALAQRIDHSLLPQLDKSEPPAISACVIVQHKPEAPAKDAGILSVLHKPERAAKDISQGYLLFHIGQSWPTIVLGLTANCLPQCETANSPGT